MLNAMFEFVLYLLDIIHRSFIFKSTNRGDVNSPYNIVSLGARRDILLGLSEGRENVILLVSIKTKYPLASYSTMRYK